MSRKDWTAPAPLEVERPRLPWWVLLPRPVLVALSPLIAVYLVVRAIEQSARRVYRYPLCVLGPLVVLVLGVAGSWWWALAAVAGAGLAVAVWRWRWPGSFDRAAAQQLRSEWRRVWVYARVWRRTMMFAALSKHIGRTRYFPRIRRVRAEGWRDRVCVGLLHGQAPTEFVAHADALAHAFGAASCRVRIDQPRRVWLDLIHRDPLRTPIAPPPLAVPGTVVDLRKIPIGATETGRAWLARLLGNHLLVVGSTGAGKSSIAWSLLWQLAPALRAGTVQVFGVDPKGGMELGRAPDLFTRLVFDNGPDAVELLEHVATLTRQRAEELRLTKSSAWSPSSGSPFVLLIVDELADVVAYQTDRALRTRAQLALQTIASQGRAPGVCALGQVQDPRKSVIDFRHLFPTKIALRLDEPEQVDMVLGDGARPRGAAAHEISEDTPGVAWTATDGRRAVQRARAFHLTDTHLAELSAYVTGQATALAITPPTAPALPEAA